ncbi:MAG: PAS domain-containing protein [bacterium]|nr:PAS domain-containing protein [bacterium]
MEGYGQQIINSLTSGIVAVDGEGAILTSNRAAADHLHATEADLQPGRRVGDVGALAPMAQVFEEVRQSGETVSRREIYVPLPDGTKQEIGLSASLLEGPEPFNGVIFLFIDMTERRQLERAAELNRQLASLGELTAGVVHELRNPLSVISGMSELLMRKLEGQEDLERKVKAIFEETKHLERSISQFLGLARPFELKPHECHPRDVVERALQLCHRRAEKKQVTVSTTCDDDVPAFRADPERLAQAVVNIVNNGIDALDPGGFVEVLVHLDDGFVEYEILDNGPGIHLNDGEDLFSPFFTKKEAGTGLGLTIVHRIVAAHHGKVSYANREAGGARFLIQIPAEAGRITDSPF